MEKVLVGMSGGVDSAVTALLLKQAGYEVVGITLRTWQSDDGSESRCCEIDDAREVARRLNIEFFPVNCTLDFQSHVVDPFIKEYLRGMTPNPCVVCNKAVKWDKLLYYAAVVGAQKIATGHYASVIRLENGRYTVKTALHAEKDQTYMLYRLTQEQLAATLMPLGNYTKSEVRQMAKDAGLPVANKPDSQDICFIPDGSYADFIEKHADKGSVQEGNFVDSEGRVLGTHKGILHYTVGQRKGLGISLGYPAYVTEIRPKTNEVVIASEDALYRSEILCGDLNFLSISGLEKGQTLPCRVKIRYQHAGTTAKISLQDEDTLKISFDSPVRAATPGQSAVFYDEEDRVIGGGKILRAL